MNLFELNTRLAVKLGQSLETLYNLEWLEYSCILNIVKKDTEEANDTISSDPLQSMDMSGIRVNLPDHLKLK
jgi:hypothetical protein